MVVAPAINWPALEREAVRACDTRLGAGAAQAVWQLAGLPEPGPKVVTYTLSLDTPEAMRTMAASHAHRPVLKIKLGTPDDMPRLEAVRQGAPRSKILIDANEGWTPEIYTELAPHLVRLGVALVEQPLPVCADESCFDAASLPALKGRYDMVNLKLDKTGGLTEGLRTCDSAARLGFGLMVGCMVGSSLAMAPAVLLAQSAQETDLDGPLLLREDRAHPLRYDAQGVHPSDPQLWG